MAILKKRTSSKQIPDAKALNRAPLSSIINGVGNNPNLGGGAGSITSVGGSKPSLTAGTSSKPSITNNSSSTTKPTLTTSITGAPKQTLTSATKPSSSISNKVVNALTGAAIGAGTKLLIDKITSKPDISKTPEQKAAEDRTLNASVLKDKNAAAEKTKAEAEAKKKAEVVNAKSGPTSVVKPPVINPSTGKPSGTGFGEDKEEFTTDSLGNVYKTMPDGTSELYRAAEVAEDEFMTDSLGNVYKTMPDGSYELYRAAEADENIDVTSPDKWSLDNLETPSFEPEYFEDSLGNVYISTADGGYDLYRAAEVPNEFPEEPTVEEKQYYDDGNGNTYVLNDSGEYELYRAADAAEDFALNENSSDEGISFQEANNLPFDPYKDYVEYDDNKYNNLPIEDYFGPKKSGGLITMMKKGGGVHMAAGGLGVQTFDDGSYIQTFDDGSTITFDSDGNIFDSTDAPQTTIDDSGNYIVTDDYGNMTVYDPNGNLIPLGGGRANVGSGSRSFTPGNKLNNSSNAPTAPSGSPFSAITDFLGTTAGAAGAGALLASILGSDMGGGTGAQNQGLDMTQVGVINPRTTNFGIGPTNFVGYKDYGTSGGEYTPNAELLKNLNAPGYNPVNEGDYGYDEVPAQENVETSKMSSGGLSSMATPVASYYTFGQPADILANLGMRAQPPMNPPEMMPQIGQQQQPQQTQQQGLPQQAPPQMAQQMPQGMPQQGMMPQQQGMAPPMRKGGLPHVSNVPMTQGRMDFRQGSAVHGEGDGQSDDIPAMLADGEYVIDAETVAQIGNGSTKAGAQALDKFREGIRAHKRSAPLDKIPPKTKALTSYLKGAR